MSKQMGIVKLEGSLSGIAFYKSVGQYLARTAAGPSKQQIATGDNFVRTRENNTEFGGAAKVSKAMRTALAGAIFLVADSRIASRLTKTFRELCNRDTNGIRGQRSILLSKYPASIKGFELNASTSLNSIFNAAYSATHDVGRAKAQISIPSFTPEIAVHAPAGATHFLLLQVLGVVSDYKYNIDLQAYEPTSPDLNTLNNLTASDFMMVKGSYPDPITIETELPGAPDMTSDASVLQCLGIEFFQKVGTQYYPLAQGNAMRVIDVF